MDPAAVCIRVIYLDSLMLDKAGIADDSSESTAMNVCADCFATLPKKKIPRFVLANGLEAHLFQSSDPVQPSRRVFHGNICAHKMNGVSTVSCCLELLPISTGS
ncbi:hypothetical protein F4604DRAFT_1585817 [Suillus subluteus]|nr:hypothetical protein F4604DRAFT_1585817 [Suillus subluteus]